MEGKKEENVDVREENKPADYLLKNKKVLIVLGVIFLVWLAFYIRTANIENLKDITTNDYTLGPDLDPFLFLRYAKYIAEQGSLMKIDEMRYVPLGFNTAGETKVLPYMIAYFHKAINLFASRSINYSAVMFPAFIFAMTVIVLFLFVRKVFDDNKHRDFIAFLSTFFFVVSPSLVSRTVAGIPEKEGVGFFFMFLVFYFFICSWKSKNIKEELVYGFLSGLSTALMGLVWGGWIYVFISISLLSLVYFIAGKREFKKFLAYMIWFAVAILGVLIFSQKYTLKGLLISTSTGLSFIIFSLILIDLLIFNTKIKNSKYIEGLRKKIPDRFVSVIILILVVVIGSTIFFGLSFIPNFVSDIVFHLTQPYYDRLSFTVAENRQPYFDEWRGSFGPIIMSLPLFFWLFFIGSIFLFYDSIKAIDKKARFILTSSYILFLLGLIFSRYSPSSIMNGINNASKFVYFGSFIVLALASLYVYYNYYKQNKLEELEKINFSYLIVLTFFFTSIIGARSAIRLIMVLALPAVIIIGYFGVMAVKKVKEQEDENLKIIFMIVAVIVIASSAYTLWIHYQSSLGGARSMIPSIYTHQWQNAMAWVRENTSKNAVFSHWWDYGYWVQSIGERATVLDGGNLYPYWDHLLGRHVLTGQDENEALEFLYTHKANYLLIDSTDIGKYPAYSSIGSDENYDRYSQISAFLEDETSMRESKNDTIHLYRGGIPLDRDFIWKDNATGKQEIFPAYKSGVGGVLLRIGKDGSLKQPEAVFIYQGKTTNIPLRYVYYKNKTYDFETGYNGAIYLIPRLLVDSGRVNIKDIGAGMFISEKSMKALWVKLYLFSEAKNFELVHEEDSIILTEIKKQGFTLGNIVYFNEILGPIKIWKINYPQSIEIKEEYLETEYPKLDLKIAKTSYY